MDGLVPGSWLACSPHGMGAAGSARCHLASMGPGAGTAPGPRLASSRLVLVERSLAAWQRSAPLPQPDGTHPDRDHGLDPPRSTPDRTDLVSRLAFDSNRHDRASPAHLYRSVGGIACRHLRLRTTSSYKTTHHAQITHRVSTAPGLDIENPHGKPLAVHADQIPRLGYKCGPLGPFERRTLSRRHWFVHFCYQATPLCEKTDTWETYTHLSAPRKPPGTSVALQDLAPVPKKIGPCITN